MKSFEKLEKMYEKEVNLYEMHKKNAADIKRQIDMQKGKIVSQKINTLNLNGSEYDKLMDLLSSGKKTVLEAAELIIGNGDRKEDKEDEQSAVIEIEKPL